MFVPVYNLTDGPVPIDFAGRTIGGHEWGVAWRSDDRVTHAVENGQLAVLQKVSKEASDEAVEADDRAKALNDRHERAEALPKGELLDLARDLPDFTGRELDPDDEPTVYELRRAVALADVDLPATKPTPKTQEATS